MCVGWVDGERGTRLCSVGRLVRLYRAGGVVVLLGRGLGGIFGRAVLGVTCALPPTDALTTTTNATNATAHASNAARCPAHAVRADGYRHREVPAAREGPHRVRRGVVVAIHVVTVSHPTHPTVHGIRPLGPVAATTPTAESAAARCGRR